MHGLAVVSECFLCEPLRVAAYLAPFRPGIPIRMKGDAFDAKSLTTLLELRGAVTGANCLQIWKQWACRVQTAQNRLDVRAEMNHDQTARFLSGVSDCLVGPVNVFRLEIGNVGLRAAQMPAQFVEAAPLRVLFPLNDELMFVAGDGALVLVAHFRPEALRNERPRQPVHRDAEVVQFPQVHIRADRASLEGGEQIFRLRLNDDTMAYEVQGGFFCGPPPAVLGRAMFGLDNVVESILPCAG